MKPARFLPLLLAAALLTGCSSDGIETKDAIRAAMVDYLQAHSSETGLDPASMDVNVDAVVFERDVARATVSFVIKGGTQGMQMNYVFDRQGDKWVTRPRPTKGAPHPAIEEEKAPPPVSPGQPLPQGHPPISGTPK